MATRRRLGFIGPTRTLESPFDQPCTVENARLAKAVAALGPLFFGDMKIQTAILHLTCPPPGSQARYHLHPFLEATCVLEGAMEYRLEGRSLPVRRGEIFCMPPEAVHGWRCAARRTVLFGFLLAVSPTADRPGSMAFQLAEATAKTGYRLKPSAELRRAFEALRAEVRGERPYREPVVAAYVRLIVPLIFRHLADALGLRPASGAAAGAEGGSRSAQLFLQAKAFVEANLALGASLADAANHLGLSPRHLNRIFKEREGVAVGRFIAASRLEKARQVLRERRELSVKSVAALCGVKDVSYFCRIFREATGKTPASFAASAGAGEGTVRPPAGGSGRRIP